jgi:hypothetical protein
MGGARCMHDDETRRYLIGWSQESTASGKSGLRDNIVSDFDCDCDLRQFHVQRHRGGTAGKYFGILATCMRLVSCQGP